MKHHLLIAFPALCMAVNAGAAETLPFFTDFSLPETAGKFTVLDLNAEPSDPYPYTWVIGTKTVDINAPDAEEQFAILNQTDPQWRDGVDTGLHLAAVYNGYRRSDYTHKPGRAGNDFLITPAFTAHKGKEYTLKVVARANSNMNEGNSMKIYVAPQPTAEAMLATKPIGQALDIKDASYLEENPGCDNFSFQFTPDFDGELYVGFLATSDPDKIFWINSISLDVEGVASSPMPVSGLTVTPGAAGTLVAAVEFDAPVNSVDGNALVSVDRIAIYRDDEQTIHHEYTGVTPGEHVIFTDDKYAEGSAGMHTYRVVASSNGAGSQEVSASAWIGEDVTGPAGSFTIEETDDSYELSWETPTTALHGGYVDFDALEYTVLAYVRFNAADQVQSEMGTVAGNHMSVPKSKFDGFPGQYFITFYLFPMSSAGTDMRNSSSSAKTVGGQLFELPFKESFADGSLSTVPWTVNDVPEYGLAYIPAWGFSAEDPSRFGLESQDGDGGYAIFHNTEYPIFPQRLVSPKISVAGAKNPVLVFYTGYTGSKGQWNSLSIELMNGENYIELGTQIPLSGNGWTEHRVPLVTKEGLSSFRISFKLMGAQDEIVLIDNISVKDENDGAVGSVETSSVKVFAEEGRIVIKGDCPYAVFSGNGILMEKGVCSGSASVGANAGIYIVKAGNTVSKCIVR